MVPGRIVQKGSAANSCVVIASVLSSQGRFAHGGILRTRCVATKRVPASGCVSVAGGIAEERIVAGGRVDDAGRVAEKRPTTYSRITVTEVANAVHCAELTVCVYYDEQTVGDTRPSDTGDKRSRLRAKAGVPADADSIRFVARTSVANVNIIVARDARRPGAIAQRNVVVADRVAKERPRTGGRVVDAGCVVLER